MFAATSPLLADIGGVHLRSSGIPQLDDERRPFDPRHSDSAVTSHSIDPASARRLWELGEALITA
ncbi:hypothetical protein POF50_025615 [Streptomyces sp. SL13]|uniref:Uncharacterized protein n=1 Tax=Streptantibioticus silvisoli TaxID=2705255 RepID=A0AA90HBP1_9ACTN|nr:hypothetical protein [Streptantibioticus silvisoli]MDI5972680.1 hypothetical protein [Streptantibioticus silvisoli]